MYRLSALVHRSIRDHAKRALPAEACGYLGGADYSAATVAYPMNNIDESSEHFAFDPVEQFSVLKQARNAGLVLNAVYHSHPTTPARMSEEDLRLLKDPAMAYLIYSVDDDELAVFKLDEEREMRRVDLTIYVLEEAE